MKVDGCTDKKLAEAYFNSGQSAHKEVCRLETLIAEKDREIERLREAVDSAYLDVYPAEWVGGDNPYDKRTEWMEGWNAAALAMAEEITKHLIYGDMGEKDEGEK